MHDERPTGRLTFSLGPTVSILHVQDVASARHAVFRIREVLRDPPHGDAPREWRVYRDGVEVSQAPPLGRMVFIRIGATGDLQGGQLVVLLQALEGLEQAVLSHIGEVGGSFITIYGEEWLKYSQERFPPLALGEPKE